MFFFVFLLHFFLSLIFFFFYCLFLGFLFLFFSFFFFDNFNEKHLLSHSIFHLPYSSDGKCSYHFIASLQPRIFEGKKYLQTRVQFFETKFHKNIQIIFVNILTLSYNLMIKGKKAKHFYHKEEDVIFYCYTFSLHFLEVSYKSSKSFYSCS